MAKILLRRVRLSFPNIWEPKGIRNPDGTMGQPSYSCNVLIEPEDPQVVELEKLMKQVAQEKWKDTPVRQRDGSTKPNWEVVYGMLESKDRLCLHNGDFKADYDGYPGMYFLSARSSTRPLILDRRPFVVDDAGRPVLDEKGKRIPNELSKESGRPYGGCFVNLSVDIYAQDNSFGQRINATLKGVQFVEDGDAFAAGPPADPEEFDDLTMGEQSAGQDLNSMM